MKTLTLLLLVTLWISCTTHTTSENRDEVKKQTTVLTRAELRDKIKGGWAGQVIGCTFGGPTEFRFKGSMINDYQPIPWTEDRCLWYYTHSPGLYDDVYMDLTFVETFEKHGLDAPASAHALAFAHADYMLWHANQAARYNILNGIMPPQSGHWLNNPHADDIDFQIEADFAGLMAPGMVNAASEICNRIGHIMNYGDGWYGGVYVAAMYSLAFVSGDVNYVVREALKAIPESSQFYQCIADVIAWHEKFPGDWKQTWFETEKKWSADIGCPDGVFRDFNIDAKINAAYIVIGLLYGEGDFSKTLEISTRCGQDSDCNPASAGGILGTMLGYSQIPEFWKKPVYPVEDMDFRYTTVSLNDVYEMGTKHALQMLERNGVNISGDTLEIPVQQITPVPLEVAFEGHYPVDRMAVNRKLNGENHEVEVDFTGNGFVLTGGLQKSDSRDSGEQVIQVEMTVDDGEKELFSMSSLQKNRRLEVAWKYQLTDGPHRVKITIPEPVSGIQLNVGEMVVYSSVKPENTWKTHF